jgi:putative membrane protein
MPNWIAEILLIGASNPVNILVLLVGLLHLYFMVLEMFLWQTPRGLKTFGNTPERARDTATLAANQGLYNGFLGAGLIWSVFYPWGLSAHHIKTYFLSCVIIAGIYGARTVSRKIFYVQALPAIITLALLWIFRPA